MRTIGLIGLGLVGTALARRFRDADFAVRGYDVSLDRRQALAAAGGKAVDSAADAAGGCDAVVLSLPDSKIVAKVVDEISPSLAAKQLVIDTSTGEPTDAEALGKLLAARGVDFLDATIAGSSVQVSQGRVIVMAGGEKKTFDRAKALFASFAERTFLVGPWGSGARMKLVVNLVLGLNRAALAEALALAAALDVDGQQALAILQASPASSKVMETKGPKMLAGDFAPQARLSQHLKDVRLILEAAARADLTLPLSTVHRELLERLEAAGLGDLDNSAIARAYPTRAARPE